ncbi:7633_t:CDS:2 [Ambispora leptoticha]|uniref:7633_t:CDS:1 n=1 Tax=Ambispora leptoticha TaxID=144679 RepID=A0A9N8WFS6_9GLOM|nr:7633_t:CDS:2 [Ambispora leptoticha]
MAILIKSLVQIFLLHVYGHCFLLFFTNAQTASTNTGSKFDKLILFGDSYSDVGNIYSITNHTWPPSPSYNGRYSDGPIWPDYLMARLNLSGVENYAFGSATLDMNLIKGVTGPNNNINVPGVVQQVNKFCSLQRGTDLSNLLASIWIIGNDYLYSNYTIDPQQIISILGQCIGQLYNTGIRYFLIPNLFNITLLPVSQYSKQIPSQSQQVLTMHNNLLQQLIANFSDDHADATIYSFDTDSFLRYFKESLANESGIDNFVEPCYADYKNSSSVCSNSRKYMFWDWLNLESKVHFSISAAFERVIAGESWRM